MINVFLYCSYSGSAVGYQKAVVDRTGKTVRSPREGEIPKLVNQIWTHGGAIAAAGIDEGVPYFLMKRVEYLNEAKQRDEQGRKVFMNCAFTGNDRSELRQFADGFFSRYQASVKMLGDLLAVDDTEIGYTIQNFDGLDRLLSSCLEAGKRVHTSYVGTLEGAISFIALEGDWAYFVKQNHVPSAPRPKVMLESKAYERMLTESRKDISLLEPETPPPKWPDVPPRMELSQRPVKAAPSIVEAKDAVTESAQPDAKRDQPPVMFEPKRSKQDYEKSLGEMEKRFTSKLCKMEEKVNGQGLLVKAALALSAAAVLLALILHNWGGGQ